MNSKKSLPFVLVSVYDKDKTFTRLQWHVLPLSNNLKHSVPTQTQLLDRPATDYRTSQSSDARHIVYKLERTQM